MHRQRKRFNEKFMALAIKEARKNLKSLDGGPFGACIVKDGKVLAVARNTVLKNDASCHAEINAIRVASGKTGSFDLSGADIYSSTEPCPMCFAAIHWAKISNVIYGTRISDVKRLGFDELTISALKMKTLGKSNVTVISGFQVNKCRKLLKDWSSLKYKPVY